MASASDDKRWEGVSRVYTRQDVEKLRGSLKIDYTLARHGAERLWKLLHSEPYVHALGALTGNQAVQQVQGEGTLSAAGIGG
jgi:isocitrate lyase